jgi:hypothetical protein
VRSSLTFAAARSRGSTRGHINKEEAIRRIEEWDLLARKLQVGVFIRKWGLSEEQTKAAEDLRERLEEMRDLLRDRSEHAEEKAKEAQGMVNSKGAVIEAYAECKNRYGYP